MSTFDQSTGVAEKLASEQREISIAEFFEQNKQMLGFGSQTRALVTAVKEGVDNSLDAAEEAGILPDIYVEIQEKDQYYTLILEDNGPGLPKDSIPSVFGKLLYGSRFHSRAQHRGQQGIGISAAVLYSQLTSGNPARITSKTKDSDVAYYMELGIDTDTNEPVMHAEEETPWDKEHGVRVEMDMEGNMRARKRLHQYIEQTAVVNPHATIELHEPDYDLVYDDRPVEELPDEVEEIKPHPHGVELGTLQDMLEKTDCIKLNAFFKTEFTRVGQKTAEGILNEFRDEHYGRALAWPVSTYRTKKEDYREVVFDAVQRKGPEATEKYFEYIYEDFVEQSNLATFEDLQNSVKKAAEKTGNETSKQFAETVQDKTVDAIWEFMTGENVNDFVIDRVSQVTVDRKSTKLVANVGRELSAIIRSSSLVKFSTKSELENAVERAAEKGANETDGTATFGATAQEKVVDDLWSKAKTVTTKVPLVREVYENRDIASDLLKGMQRADAMAPPTKCLSPITEEDIEMGLRSRYDAEFYTSSTRSAQVSGGEPFIVESGIAYGGNIENGKSKIQLSRFANRVPLVYQEGGCAITQVVKNMTWNTYYTSQDKISQSQGSLPQGPMVLLVHIASTNVPFTSESKDAVSNVEVIENEVERAVRDVARDLKDYMKQERTRKKQQQKRDEIGGILSDMANRIEMMTNQPIEAKDESQARILNNVYVDLDKSTLVVKNYSNRKETLEITGKLVDTTINNIDLGEFNLVDEGSFEYTYTLDRDEEISIDIGSEVSEFTVECPEEENYTLKSNIS